MSEQHAPSGTVEGASPITLSLKLFCDLRRYIESDEADIVHVQAPAGVTAHGLLRHLRFDPNEQVTFAVNGALASSDTVLHEGDDLMLFRPVRGE